MTTNESHLTRPLRHPEARLLGQRPSGKLVFVNFSRPDWAALSPSLAMLFSLCDGRRGLDELAALARVDGTGVSPDSLLPVMRHLWQNGLLAGPEEPSSDDEVSPLTTLALYVTRGCNLRCRYCFFSAAEPLPGEMDTTTTKQVMAQFQALGGRLLQFLGGEPLLRPDIIELGQYARELGLTSNLITNGTLLEPGLARRVAQTFDTVQVSLDGLEPVNDRFRGRGSHARTVAGLRNLLELGVKPTVSTVVSQANIDALEDFLAELVELGVSRVHFVNLQPCGRGRSTDSSALSSLDFAKGLLDLWQRWGHRLEFPRDMLLSLPRGQRKLNCRPAQGILEVDPRGLAFPCYYFMEKGLSGGDLRRQPLAEIYQHSPQLTKLRRVSVDRHPRCAVCDYRYLCGGGCLGIETATDQYCQDMIQFINWVLLEGRELRLLAQGAPETNSTTNSIQGVTAPPD